MASLRSRAWAGLAALVALLAAALFWTAGTLAYAQAWAFLGVFTSATTAITVYLMKRDPALLERRVQAGPLAEKIGVQRVISSLASVAFMGIIILSALDRRMGWSNVTDWQTTVGDLLVAGGLGIVFLVFRANSFTSGTIEIAAHQTTISSGPYAVVRHPMYAGASVMLLGLPWALGSWWGLAAVALMLAVLVWRLIAEERTLGEKLAGYGPYRRKVKYRLIPGVW